MSKKTGLSSFIICCFFSLTLQAQNLAGHSHNDYEQQRPFFSAYENFFASIEVDVWAVDGQLFVAHDLEDIHSERTFEKLYLNPILEVYQQNVGKPYPNANKSFQLLIDLKTPYNPTLYLLKEILSQYPEVFDPQINTAAVRIVISGNSPSPEFYGDFPEFIFFDGRPNINYNDSSIKRIALISDSFDNYSDWNGETKIDLNEFDDVIMFIEMAHALGKKARLWGAPDTPLAWDALTKAGMDFINTDQPAKLKDYFSHK
jgi:alkaline phosphatase